MSDILNDRYEDNAGMSLLARDQYERGLRWIEVEPLSPQEEKKYLDRVFRARRDPSNRWFASLAKDARERLTEYYQPNVARIVSSYACAFRDMDFLDLVQEANIALLRAFDTFDSDSQEVTFAGWMFGCIRMALRRLYWERSGFVRLPDYVRRALAGIAAIEGRFLKGYGRHPTNDELCRELDVTLQRLFELLHYRALWFPYSLDEIYGRSQIPEDAYDFAGMYQQFSQEELARSDALTACFEAALSRLGKRQQEVMRLRYGLCGESGHTHEEVCELLGITPTNVHAMVNRGRKGLRVLLAPLYEGQEAAV